MISLEQIHLLEARIDKAVELIKRLKAENSTLRKTLDSAQSRMQDLEARVQELKSDQGEIEQSILRAIHSLDELEDEVSGSQEAAEGRTKRPSRPAGGGRVGAAASSSGEAASAEKYEGAESPGSTAEPEGDEGGPHDESGELDIF